MKPGRWEFRCQRIWPAKVAAGTAFRQQRRMDLYSVFERFRGCCPGGYPPAESDLPHCALPQSRASDGEEVSARLRVNASLRVDGQRRVRGAARSGQGDLVQQHSSLADRVEDPVLGIRVDGAVRVDGGGVDAP